MAKIKAGTGETFMKAKYHTTTGLVSAGVASMAAVGFGANDASAQGVENWAGFYAGLAVGTRDGSFFRYSDDAYNFQSDPTTGVFVGYNWALGNLLMGVEFAYSPSDIGMEDNGEVSDPDDYSVSDMIDIALRLGAPIGDNVLVYGFGGLSAGTMWHDDGGEGYHTLGMNYGIGIDYLVTESISVGARVTGRNMGIEVGDGMGDGGRESSHELSLRAAFHF
ncbi:outer membrane beta-barrel protein [Rhodobacterales bacterium HKCCSP123]|nr:outer membrane beta-barrel protein [Rhodobacterales bacterium HKCCSP123]